MGVLFLFIDGIGVGENSERNPFSTIELPGFYTLLNQQRLTSTSKEIYSDRILFKSIDANLDIDGLPQSGTGQASLFSGQNASKIIGKHFGPYPHTGNKHLLTDESIFNQLQKREKSVHFINAFPNVFFERSKIRNRWSSCTLMTRSAGLKINSEMEVIQGKAITAEILQDFWREKLNIDIPVIDYEIAANRVYNAVDTFDFTLMEYYLTDKAGHEQSMDAAAASLERIDGFIQSYLRLMDTNDTLIITSDHGNLEELTVRTHTRNPVPFIVFGRGAGQFMDVKSIVDVTPAIISYFSN
ncbi:MAG TPA: hypothetical protein DCE78_10890 [Bacteroidetes bacterium]|nr:hypothetical protein [Bacteroidota bacterium]